ncbi:hypothetical protein HK405_006672 [Cladochytrium tenue]|nr:hypothetical protein HK405_006672 [Cladochytrium tenue]
MVLRFCSVDRLGIRLHIHTVTESRNGCYVTSTPLVMPQPDIVVYVSEKLKLCHPPDTGVTDANGGDGPENTAAGVAALAKKFAPDENVVCFLITDADPHHRAFGRSAEAILEEKWLKDNGFPTDIYEVLNHVIESLNVTFVPILYKTPSAWFNQAAALSGGLVLFPESKDSALLASGLVSLLDALQTRVLHPDADVRAPSLPGFRALASSLDDLTPLTADPVPDPAVVAAAAAAPSGTLRKRRRVALPSTAGSRGQPGPPQTSQARAVDHTPTVGSGTEGAASTTEALGKSLINDDVEASVERLLKTAAGRFHGRPAARRPEEDGRV